jgi:hypothetical protein
MNAVPGSPIVGREEYLKARMSVSSSRLAAAVALTMR